MHNHICRIDVQPLCNPFSLAIACHLHVLENRRGYTSSEQYSQVSVHTICCRDTITHIKLAFIAFMSLLNFQKSFK